MPGMSSEENNTDPIIEPESGTETETQPVAKSPDEDNTLTFKRSHFYAVLTVLAFSVGVLLGYVVWGFDPDGGQAQTARADQPSGPVVEAPVTEAPQFVRYDIPSEGFPSIGPADAPITIVEFSDYQCPYCRRWHEQVYKPLLDAYPGKIRMVYRHLPLTSIHPDAMAAAEAAMCAGDQDAYWPFHDKLFSGNSLDLQTFTQYAQELSLNVEDFQTCLEEDKFKNAIETDSNFALDLGVRSTPTFFINGLALVGAQPLDVFKQVIDQELAGEIPQ